MNKCLFTGNIANDLELGMTKGREGRDPMAVLNFRLAVTEYARGARRTNFIPIVAFGRQAEQIAAGCCKGSRLTLSARAQMTNYIDKNGKRQNFPQFILTDFDFVDSKMETEARRAKSADRADDAEPANFE